MRKLLFFLTLAAVSLAAAAQDCATCPESVFRVLADTLVSRGNQCYDRSDRTGIRTMADSLRDCLDCRAHAGMLTSTDSAEYYADWNKLMGNYYYEDSNYGDPATAYTQALRHYRAALDIYAHTPALEGNLYHAPMIHRELAQLYYKQGNYPKALAHTDTALVAWSQAADLDAIPDEMYPTYIDVQTQRAMCLSRMGRVQLAIEMIDSLIAQYVEADTLPRAEALRKKGKILMLGIEGGNAQNDSAMTLNQALACYKAYFSVKRNDALRHFMTMTSPMQREEYWMRMRPFVTDCYRLEDADAGFLYDVTLFAKGILLQLDSRGGGRQNLQATWQDVQQKLNPGECAIEFVQYEKRGRQQMAALVLPHNGEPRFVRLSPPENVLKYKVDGPTKNNRFTVEERIHYVVGADSVSCSTRNAVYEDPAVAGMIWTLDLLTAIGPVTDIWFAPDGYIHRIAIEYMLPLVADSTIACHRLTCTRRLLDRNGKPATLAGEPELLVGGVDYKAILTNAAAINDAFAFIHAQSKGVSFDPLPSTGIAADNIRSIRDNGADLLLRGEQVTEQRFREYCSQFPIMWISTHGVYDAASVPQGTDVKPAALCDSTLSHSYLAFAGSNTNLQNASFNPEIQDGLLSAREIASLDLSKTRLVLLSCCETGLGQITADGVYGLQRGFKNAGAGAIICSLWDVYDVSTNLFMAVLHYHLTQGDTLTTAFRKARNAMANYKHPDEHPCFDLSEDYYDDCALKSAGSYVRRESGLINDNLTYYRFPFILIDALE